MKRALLFTTDTPPQYTGKITLVTTGIVVTAVARPIGNAIEMAADELRRVAAGYGANAVVGVGMSHTYLPGDEVSVMVYGDGVIMDPLPRVTSL
jgi:uncharacterized protein YbjQ (UPF0145 family)